MFSYLLQILMIFSFFPPSSQIRSFHKMFSNSRISISLPLITVGGAGELMRLNVGEPPQTLHLIADTGGDATWIYCDHLHQQIDVMNAFSPRVFDPSRSSSFKPLGSDSSCDKNNNYTIEYEDGTIASGFWVNETLTIRSHEDIDIKLNNVTIGCSSNVNSTDLVDADGILGLSPSPSSFTGRLSLEFGSKFSLILARELDPSTDNLLVFGDVEKFGVNQVDLRTMRYTNLLVFYEDPQFYYVEITGIFIDKRRLGIPKSIWKFNPDDGSGGVILDTGTVFTYVPSLAFRAIHAVYSRFLCHYFYENVKITEADLCFDPSSLVEFDEVRFPQIEIEFGGEARLVIYEENLFIEDEEGMKCLGFKEVGDNGGSIIGNVLQRGYVWEYDLLKHRVGFAAL